MQTKTRKKKTISEPSVSRTVSMPLSVMNDLADIAQITSTPINEIIAMMLKEGISTWKVCRAEDLARTNGEEGKA